jgi:hypothetical protein
VQGPSAPSLAARLARHVVFLNLLQHLPSSATRPAHSRSDHPTAWHRVVCVKQTRAVSRGVRGRAGRTTGPSFRWSVLPTPSFSRSIIPTIHPQKEKSSVNSIILGFFLFVVVGSGASWFFPARRALSLSREASESAFGLRLCLLLRSFAPCPLLPITCTDTRSLPPSSRNHSPPADHSHRHRRPPVLKRGRRLVGRQTRTARAAPLGRPAWATRGTARARPLKQQQQQKQGGCQLAELEQDGGARQPLTTFLTNKRRRPAHRRRTPLLTEPDSRSQAQACARVHAPFPPSWGRPFLQRC